MTPSRSPRSTAEAASPVTAATTPRPKFPSDLKTLSCTWPGCPKSFNRPARLRQHLNSHTNSRPFKCPYPDCDKDYIEDKHLKQHVKAAHTHDRKYVCQRAGCGKSFVTGTRLKRHQAVHEGADRFRCRDCGQSFRKKETLHKHCRKDHLGVPAHECSEPDCGQAFDSKPALKRHFERAHAEPRFWCGECGLRASQEGAGPPAGFPTEALLMNHLRREHQECIFCDSKPASRWELQQHVEVHHSGKTVDDRKTEACPHHGCPKRFTKKSNLRAHIRTAHEGFRFLCGQVALSGPGLELWSPQMGCGQGFSTKLRLEDHVRHGHLGQPRPPSTRRHRLRAPDAIDDLLGLADGSHPALPCQHCPATFARFHELNLHLASAHVDHPPAATAAPAPAPASPSSALPLDDPLLQLLQLQPGDDDDDELFAADMDYAPDEWPADEAAILLLARDPPTATPAPAPQHDPPIDPSLNRPPGEET